VKAGPRVLVAGGGALGRVCALALARAGADVILADPNPPGVGASGVAAGMLAPAFESLFDAEGGDPPLLTRARDLWAPLAASIGLSLDRRGAMAVGSGEQVDLWERGLRSTGATAERLAAASVTDRSPGVAAGLEAVWTGEDWRLDPHEALAALTAAAGERGVRERRASVEGFDGGRASLSNGETIDADALVIATGHYRALADLAPELSALTPIKGHILRAPGLAFGGPVVRARGAYICPSTAGALIGATMEEGRDDDTIEPGQAATLCAAATAVFPAFADTPLIAATGVRGATPDRWPLVGLTRTHGVWLAVGARRNGWLLAPLIAEALTASLLRGEEGPDARRFDPARLAALSPRRA